MDGYILKGPGRGSSLLELSLGFVLVVLLIGSVAMAAGKVMEYGRGQRTLEDMAAILQACRQYDVLNGGWPSSLSALHEVLPQAGPYNIWGHPFVLGSGPDRVWVETDVPVGAIHAFPGKGRVRLSSGRAYGPVGRLVYEKRNIYGP